MAATKAVHVEDASTISDPTSDNPGHTSLRKTQLQGGYECFFVKDPPPELQTDCCICLCHLREPHLMDCKCGSNFCRTCIEPVKAEGKPCPLCNSSFTTAIPNRQLERVLNEMHVYCSHKDSGCGWEGELVSLPQHLNIEPLSDNERLSGCPFTLLKCSHCKEDVLRQDIVDHETNRCLQRPFSCDYCHDYESTCEDVTSNHWPICPFRPTPCPNECGVYPERQNLEEHLERACPITVVECPFSYAGCVKRIPRKDMPLHITENLASHMSWQAASHQQQLEKLQESLFLQRTHHEQQLGKLQETLSLLTDHHQKQIEELQQLLSVQTATSQHQLKNLEESLSLQAASHQQQVEKFQKVMQNVTAENEQLKVQVQKIKAGQLKLQEQTKQSQELSSQLDQRVTTLEKENKTMKRRLDQQAQTIADLLRDSKSMTGIIQEVKKAQTESIRDIRRDIDTMKVSERESSKALRSELERQSQTVLELQKDSKHKLLAMRQEIGKLKTEIASMKQNQEQLVKDKLSTIERETKALRSRLDQQAHVSTDLQKNPRGTMTTVPREDPQIERIKGDISEIRSEMNDTLKVHIGLIPLEVKMYNFRRHKTLSMDWFSSPFYTHPRGYKICLNVDANGYGEGKGTHVSVFIYMMQGEFDNELKWPFRGTITIQLLNQKRDEVNPHYTVVHFDQHTKANVASRVFDENRATSGQGMLKYVAHADLQHRFLVNDTLCFRISKVDFL